MKIQDQMQSFFLRNKWVLPLCFLTSLLLTIMAIAICLVKGFSGMENTFTFSVGADVFSMLVCTVLLYSCIQDKEGASMHTRTFVLLIMMTNCVLFSDVCCWIVQGEQKLRTLNIIVNVVSFTSAACLLYCFWQYIFNSLNLRESRIMRICDLMLNILMIPTIGACLVNFFYPLYFSVDEYGVYHREPAFMFSQTYLAIGLVVAAIGFVLSKASMRERVVMMSFVLIPVANQLLTRYTFGLTTQYAAMTVSIVLIYARVFAQRQKALASTQKELSMASGIQAAMLPSTFPAFPERDDFDIYASMLPAKEVGGDFYDFFLIDDDHLAMVIADVSGKGVPAALFMMMSRIMIKNFAMMGYSPEELLAQTNTAICLNNTKDMFVTVWYGVLEISTGKVTAANAGHEYPIVRKADGRFELMHDKHGFVLGGMEDMVYHQYEFTLEKGETIFLYTDGVAEATDSDNKMFGVERMIDALNADASAPPKKLIENMKSEVDRFVGDADQFDDLTMLAVSR